MKEDENSDDDVDANNIRNNTSLSQGDILEKLLSVNVDSPHSQRDDHILYEVLDQVPNARKTMNSLFFSKNFGRNHRALITCSETIKLRTRTSMKAHEWIACERQAESQAATSALQMDSPVIFSWTKKSQATRDLHTTVSRSDHGDEGAPKLNQITNNDLYKRVTEQLSKISKELRIDDNRIERVPDKKDPSATPNNSNWADPHFQVDPLQTFVARQLPREGKKHPTDKKKHESKRKSLFGFWSNRHKKDDSPKKSKHHNKSTDDPQRIETEDRVVHSKMDVYDEPEIVGFREISGNDAPKTLEFDLEEQTQDIEHYTLAPNNSTGVSVTENDEDEEFGEFEQVSYPQNAVILPAATEKSPDHPSSHVQEPLVNAMVAHSLRSGSPSILSVDSFIPLQPKKKT